MKRYFAPFKEARSLRRKEKFIVLSLIPLYFILIGLFLQPINEIIPGIIRIVREPDVLITDYFAVGGIGAALINAGLTTLLSIGLLYFSGKEMDGHYDHFCLPDVWIFSFWKEHCQHLGYYGRCCFICKISWDFFKPLSLCRSVRHQSFTHHDPDDAYWKISSASLSYAVPAFRTCHWFCAAAIVYPCTLRSSGIFPVQRRFWRRHYCNSSSITG